MKLRELINWLEAFAPLSLAESYDFAGLVCGNPDMDLSSVLVCLNADQNTLQEAGRLGANLIIAHHPPVFRTLKTVAETTSEGRFLAQAIRQGIAVYAAHTNFDTATGGLADLLAETLQLSAVTGLHLHGQEDFYKLIVYTPTLSLNQLRESLFAAGAGKMGLYEDCGFYSNGQGTFKPLAGSVPAIGKKGVFEIVEEARLEVLVSQKALSDVLLTLKKNHPYEKPAYDVIRLFQPNQPYFVGRIGTLPVQMDEAKFLTHLAERLDCGTVRTIGKAPAVISQIALANGSYDDTILADLRQADCKVLVTGDIKYHDALDLMHAGVYAVDAGHFYTEKCFKQGLVSMLRQAFIALSVNEADETDVFRMQCLLYKPHESD